MAEEGGSAKRPRLAAPVDCLELRLDAAASEDKGRRWAARYGCC